MSSSACFDRMSVHPRAPAFPAPVCPRASASSYPTPVRALTSHPCAHPHARFLALCLLSGVCLDGNLLGRCRKKRCDSGTTAHGVYARFVLGKARLCDRDGKQSLGSGVRWGGAWLARGGMQVAGARCLGWFWHAVCGWGAARARMARRLRGRAVRVLPGSACVGGIRAGRLPTALGSRGTASFLAFADAFLHMFHVKHLFRYRTTLRQLFHVKQSQHQRWRRTKERCPLNGGGHAKLDFAAKEGLFSRSIFQTATTARPCGKAVAAFPSVVKATVEAGQVGWKACAAKRSVLVELR